MRAAAGSMRRKRRRTVPALPGAFTRGLGVMAASSVPRTMLNSPPRRHPPAEVGNMQIDQGLRNPRRYVESQSRPSRSLSGTDRTTGKNSLRLDGIRGAQLITMEMQTHSAASLCFFGHNLSSLTNPLPAPA
jgi:hypothetical protein